MFITVELLEKRHACEPGIIWFKRHFPNGAEMLDVIADRTVTPDFLHWGHANLDYNKEELDAYTQKLNIVESNYVFESHNISNSDFVSHSSEITRSRNIRHSHDVVDSKNIYCGECIERCNDVFDSMFCSDSSRIISGKNVNNSCNTVMSNYIINSQSILNATSIINSRYVGSWLGRTSKITDSMFVSNCSNLTNCLFCSDTSNGENLLFNQKVDAAQIDMIKKQLLHIVGDWEFKLVQDVWEDETVLPETPKLERNLKTIFAELPGRFWTWLTTLPNYDPMILYSITLQENLLNR